LAYPVASTRYRLLKEGQGVSCQQP